MAGTDADQRANQAKNDELYRLEAGVKEKFKDSRYIKLNVSDDHYDELSPDNIIDTQDGVILSKQYGKFKRLRQFTIDDYVLNKLLSLQHNDYTILSELPIAGGRRATRKRVHINAKKKSNRKIHRRRKSKSSRKSVKRMHRRK